MRHLIAALFIALVPVASGAAPARYVLDQAASTVAFTYTLNGVETQGRMPLTSTDIVLDFDRAANSRLAAELDAADADAGLVFATEAMKSETVLDTEKYPQISFRSIAVSPTADGATVSGQITIRGVTKPVTLDAKVFRQRGTADGDRSRLSVLMTGQIDRTAFGASGYPSLVGDTIAINILARISLAP